MITGTKESELEPCPFCGAALELRGFPANPYGRCITDGCFLAEKKLAISLDDPRQVEQWNARPSPPEPMSKSELVLDDEALTKLEEMEAAATPAPWFQKSFKTEGKPTEGTEISQLLCFFSDEGEPRFWGWEEDGEFVAAMRNAFPALLAVVRARQTLDTQPPLVVGPIFPDTNQQEAYTIEDGLRPSPPVGELARQLRFLATCPNMPTSQLLSAAALIEKLQAERDFYVGLSEKFEAIVNANVEWKDVP